MSGDPAAGASRRSVLAALAAAGGGMLEQADGRLSLTTATTATGAVRIRDFLDTKQLAAAATAKPVDCTAAFRKAIATSGHVVVDAGNYGLDSLRLPTGCRLIAEAGAVIHQSSPTRPAIACVSDASSGQLAGIVFEGFEIVGHPGASAALVLLEARGAYAIWRSRFSYYARTCFRALEVEAADNNNIFECEVEVVSEGTTSTAVLVRGGTYNRYHFFLSRTQSWALDDASGSCRIRVVAENCVIFRGQVNQISAHVEGIAAARPASDVAITDRGFGNVFFSALVNMPAGDAGKLKYAFRAFDGTVFISPQIIGPGAPLHPFAPTSNLGFTVIGGRSKSANKVEQTFDGSDPDHDLRNITFVGDVNDFTALPTAYGTSAVQRFRLRDEQAVNIASTTRMVLIDLSQPVSALRVRFAGGISPIDGWTVSVRATHAVARLDWPDESRYAQAPRRLAAGQRVDMVYQLDEDMWLVV